MIKLNLNFKLFLLTKVFILCLIICFKSYADNAEEQKNMIRDYTIMGVDSLIGALALVWMIWIISMAMMDK